MTAQQLKNSILQMAVQGKLIPQDPSDEPASVLLERIRAEKEQMVKEGKIKKEKNLSVIFRGSDNLFYEKIGNKQPVCIADEVPFEIPENWEWTRFSSVIELQSGQDMTPDKYNSEGKGIPYITGASNIDAGSIVINRWTEFGKAFAYKGDLLLTCKGTVGALAILNEPIVHIARQIMAIRPSPELNTQFVMIILESLVDSLRAVAKSMIPGISREDILSALIALPPRKEQDRICDKYQSLKPLLDDYQGLYTASEQLNDNFPNQLKSSILQTAVQGKLVPQDPNDEPASVLLDRIRSEKEQLIKEGKLKRDKHESTIYKRDNSYYEKADGVERCIDDEIPFEIPESWEWARLSKVVSFVGGYAYKSSDFKVLSNNQVLRLGNVKNDSLKLEQKPVYISDSLANKTAKFRCQFGDILITMTGTRGKRDYFFTVMISDEKKLYINQRVGILRPFCKAMSYWLNQILKSPFVLGQVFQYETGTANQGNLGAEDILKTLIPVPPVKEQERIVLKIKSVIDVCEKIPSK